MKSHLIWKYLIFVIVPVILIHHGCYRANGKDMTGVPPVVAQLPGHETETPIQKRLKESRNNTLLLNQGFIEALYSHLNVEDIDAVFEYVFFQLPEEVYVYPTENYYYFSFYTNGGLYCGNIRLGAEDRDHGLLSFAYYNYVDDPKSPHDSQK